MAYEIGRQIKELRTRDGRTQEEVAAALGVIAQSFLGRMGNDLCYRGGTAKEIASVMALNIRALELLDKCPNGGAVYDAVYAENPFWKGAKGDLAGRFIGSRKSAKEGRLAELLKDADYLGALEKA